ncbi:hypothetical protein NGRA_2533 [Nosema granulosis]|uniref:Uncharacterized protein n=1 Tax=Nosema granulosis TaxID=83296 RepID=A0A9P6KXM0_9MICR|nr:hypothetical protein NGRA_2533 [Nosema granulosis]
MGMQSFLKFTLFLLVACEVKTPLRTPIFDNKSGKQELTVPFDGSVVISRYEIMEGELDANENSLSPIEISNNIRTKNSILYIDISGIPKTNKKQYSIKATTSIGTFYSEPFVYDEDMKKFVLRRAYKPRQFHERYLIHILIGGGILIAIGVVVYAINRRSTKKAIDEESL